MIKIRIGQSNTAYKNAHKASTLSGKPLPLPSFHKTIGVVAHGQKMRKGFASPGSNF
jgi:hypothetical protein